MDLLLSLLCFPQPQPQIPWQCHDNLSDGIGKVYRTIFIDNGSLEMNICQTERDRTGEDTIYLIHCIVRSNISYESRKRVAHFDLMDCKKLYDIVYSTDRTQIIIHSRRAKKQKKLEQDKTIYLGYGDDYDEMRLFQRKGNMYVKKFYQPMDGNIKIYFFPKSKYYITLSHHKNLLTVYDNGNEICSKKMEYGLFKCYAIDEFSDEYFEDYRDRPIRIVLTDQSNNAMVIGWFCFKTGEFIVEAGRKINQ